MIFFGINISLMTELCGVPKICSLGISKT